MPTDELVDIAFGLAKPSGFIGLFGARDFVSRNEPPFLSMVRMEPVFVSSQVTSTAVSPRAVAMT